MVMEVQVEDTIRRGFDFALDFVFEEGFLVAGDSLRADLRRTPFTAAVLASFNSVREGDTFHLTLLPEVTSTLPLGTLVTELVLVDNTGVEAPITEPRFMIEVLDHATRAAT